MPLPSRTFRHGRPVGLYYEVYNLARDEFGRTRYRVDYETRRKRRGFRVLNALGRLLGEEPPEEGTRVSYEHEGTEASEPVYVRLDVPGSGPGPLELRVRVTDLHAPDRPSVTRSLELAFGR